MPRRMNCDPASAQSGWVKLDHDNEIKAGLPLTEPDP